MKRTALRRALAAARQETVTKIQPISANDREGEDEFLPVAEVAAMLKLKQQTVRNWIDRGELPALHVGRRVRIRRSDFRRFLDESRIQPAPELGRSPAQAFWDGELPAPEPEPPPKA